MTGRLARWVETHLTSGPVPVRWVSTHLDALRPIPPVGRTRICEDGRNAAWGEQGQSILGQALDIKGKRRSASAQCGHDHVTVGSTIRKFWQTEPGPACCGGLSESHRSHAMTCRFGEMMMQTLVRVSVHGGQWHRAGWVKTYLAGRKVRWVSTHPTSTSGLCA